MHNKLPIQVKASKPTVTAIIDDITEEVQQSQFNIVDVSVERQETDPTSWRMYLIGDQGQRYTYDLYFS